MMKKRLHSKPTSRIIERPVLDSSLYANYKFVANVDSDIKLGAFYDPQALHTGGLLFSRKHAKLKQWNIFDIINKLILLWEECDNPCTGTDAL